MTVGSSRPYKILQLNALHKCHVTVICRLVESYVNAAAREAGAAAEVAASRKQDKYADLDSRYVF